MVPSSIPAAVQLLALAESFINAVRELHNYLRAEAYSWEMHQIACVIINKLQKFDG